jgi:hypothetical protein
MPASPSQHSCFLPFFAKCVPRERGVLNFRIFVWTKRFACGVKPYNSKFRT